MTKNLTITELETQIKHKQSSKRDELHLTRLCQLNGIKSLYNQIFFKELWRFFENGELDSIQRYSGNVD